ncbi:Starch-binding associating with outer membrane [Chitinophaga costaii]|uniref:Starch-binding associating with outer membrane n=1 Tax=Chitinophaga costaii TaxID=1335309 RepID=A0A1C4CU61_9BACT|nr:RagB/SusD family nutrient uptake outer membrane protein [Chitinophaga costaii]PUZ26947.1 RagB/SusD family nutrient uptake outer membrane protein [Chitinophaga costaii]SCC22586.1 Starch-binding associating with outer membrane [Chitinophaga costaii]
MHIPYKKQWAAVILGAAVLAGCTKSLDQTPQSSASSDAVFSSEAGLKLYTTSFYDFLPDINTPYKTDCSLSDYGAVTAVPDFIRANVYTSRLENSWSWGNLRNVNYFIVNNNNSAVPQAIRDNYQGLARFFRAYFYFDKIKRYGDVPWIGHPLAVNDSALYAGRDSRVLVMDSVIADLDYAASHITATDDATRSTITQAVVYGFKSRVCLFEGTYRKYRHDSLPGSNELLQQAAAAAKAVIDAGRYSLNQGTMSYRNLFISASPVANEVMLANIASSTLGKMNDANWYFTSATYGPRFSFTRDFINTYLNIDGTPFTSVPGHDTMTLAHETQQRDLRLGQTIRLAGYTRTNSGKVVAGPPVFSYTYTGYQPIKWCLDDMYYDAGANNTNSIELMRYAEILLNYAEAKAELGEMDGTVWSQTIGALRSRAGIANANTLPTIVDPYMHTRYYPDINDPVLLEIRRERAIELALEGFRYYDLVRWAHGDLLLNKWNGMYVPALNVPMDLNADGVLDVCFYQDTAPTNPVAGVTYINVGAMVGGVTNPQQLADGTAGELHWQDATLRQFENFMYLYPIPYAAIQLNSNLQQNPGWENR